MNYFRYSISMKHIAYLCAGFVLLTASYYADKAGRSLLVQREEQKVDYENLVTITQLPETFPKPNASAVWEGELEAKATGTYCFKLHYAGYTKAFMNTSTLITIIRIGLLYSRVQMCRLC